MDDEKEGRTLASLVARKRATRALLSTVVPRKLTGMDMSKADGDVFVKLVWTLWTSSWSQTTSQR